MEKTDDKVFDEIINLAEYSLEKAPDRELGYFYSEKERAYRRHVVDNVMLGLNRDNQNKAIRYIANLLMEQNGLAY